MNNTKRNEKINELESIETVLGITKAEYAAEKLLEQYEKTGLRTEALFDSLFLPWVMKKSLKCT